MEKIQLIEPIKLGGRDYIELEVRRPKVKDQLAAESVTGTDAKKEIWMFASLCGVSEEVIGELDLADYQQLQKAYQGFLTSAPKSAEGQFSA